MPLRPLNDRVIVRRLDQPEATVGSIVIPDSAKEKPQQARVVAVGDGPRLEGGDRSAMQVQPGDTVLFGKYSGSEVEIEGETYLILREDEILAVLD